MLNSFPVTLFVSASLGILAGLGVGGGSLLMLWLTLILGATYQDARIMNLLFFLPCAFISTLIRIKSKAISIKRIWPAIAAGCIGAIIASLLGRNIEVSVLKKLFGGLLICTGLRELFYRPRNAK